MEEKIYDKDLGKYKITGTLTRENREQIINIKYKDSDIPVAEALQEHIKELNHRALELDRSIAYLTDERRKKIIEYQNLKKQLDALLVPLDIEYAKEEKSYTYYEDLVHKKALIQ